MLIDNRWFEHISTEKLIVLSYFRDVLHIYRGIVTINFTLYTKMYRFGRNIWKRNALFNLKSLTDSIKL